MGKRRLGEERIPQREIVLKYLQKHGSITPVEAINELGVTRLGARIFELRDRGYKIISESAPIKNQFGKVMPLARYVYERRKNTADTDTGEEDAKLGLVTKGEVKADE